MRLADYVIDRIYKECAEHLFMVTGRGVLYLSDAVARHDKIKCISVHHEQAGAFAAVSYGMYTGKPGVCLVSTGCAATNTITGVLCAYQDGVPCVFISGQNMLNETVNYTKLPIRTFGSQETDIIPVVKPLTKYAVMITDPNKIAYELDKAIYLSQNGIKGPVWLDIPLDIQNARIEVDELERFLPAKESDFIPTDSDILFIKEALQNAERPVVLIGSGVRSADAVDELVSFVENNNIPLVYSHTAPDVYGICHDLSIGAVGSMYGTRSGNLAVQNADLLIVLGCRMTSMTTGSEPEKFAREAKIIVVDINKDEFLKGTVNIDHIVIADIRKTLEKLNNLDIKQTTDWWCKKCIHWKTVFPKCEKKYKQTEKIDLYYLAEALSETLPENSTLISDAGVEELILPVNINFKNGMRCIHPAMQGAMGYGLPAAIGANLASGRTTCAVIGDGSVMMNLQEFQTVKHNKMPIKIIIISNNMYAVIRKRQIELFRTRTIGTDPENGVSSPDFKRVAECFGISYMRIERSAELKEKLRELFGSGEAVICEVLAVENQEYLCDAYAKNSQKKIVHRPIEDLHPFIDRDLFLSEMVIEPIDQ